MNDIGLIEKYLWIPGRLPGINEILDWRFTYSKSKGRKGQVWNRYSQEKEKYESEICNIANSQGFRVPHPCYFNFFYFEPNKKRDPPNFEAGAKKLIYDALQRAHLLDGDGWHQILGQTDYWCELSESPGIALVLTTERRLNEQEAERWMVNRVAVSLARQNKMSP